MKPQQYGILNLLFWIFVFHIPLIFGGADKFFDWFLSQPQYENQVIQDLIGPLAAIFSILSLTSWIYAPAFILCVLIVGGQSEIAMAAFMSCQAFVMAVSFWLWKRTKARRVAQVNENAV
jgi:hypothetical protein